MDPPRDRVDHVRRDGAQDAPAEDDIGIGGGQVESDQSRPRECDHFVRDAAEDARGDGILAADSQHDRSELGQPVRRQLPEMKRPRHVERVTEPEVGRHRVLQPRARPASVSGAHGRGQRRETDIATAAPVARHRTEREEPRLLTVGERPRGS